MSALDRYNAMPVREVIGMPGLVGEELFRLACMGRKNWRYHEWLALIAELESCNQTVAEWREFRE